MPYIDRSFMGLVCAILFVISNSLQASDNPPSAPVNLVGSIDGTSVSLKWDVSAEGGTATGFNVYINNQYTDTVFGNGFITTVDADTPYSFYVVAFDDEDPRQYSQASESLILPDSVIPAELTDPPSIPEALTGNVDGTTVTLSWQPSTDDEAVLGYNVYRDDQYLTTVSGTTYSGDNEQNESHSWYVVAFDIRRNYSARSESIILPNPGRINTTMAPTVPTGLAGEVVPGGTSDTVTLTWAPSTDDQSVAGYNIYQNGQYIATRFNTQYSGTVETGSSNSFSVVAFDDERNFSTSSDAITLSGETGDTDRRISPTVPVNLAGDTTTINGQTRVQLTWSASTSSARVAGYNIYRNDQYHDTVSTNAYSEEVSAGIAFTYSVVAFDESDNFSSRSEPLTLVGDTDRTPIINEGTFTLAIAQATYELQEGDPAGINVPLTVTFSDADSSPVTLSVNGVGSDDDRAITASFSRQNLSPAENTTELNMQLAIDVLPIFSGQRRFTVTASNGTNSSESTFTVDVSSVARDDVYLLIGQSNMVGESEIGAKQAGAGGADEPNTRIRQANVEFNNADQYTTASDFTNVDANFRSPMFLTAQDPLHDPVDPDNLSKDGTHIGMGLSLAKSALSATSRSIVLVPAAWGGTGFCNSTSRPGQWNALPTSQPELGNTLLFDRALTRINETLLETGGILRGIIWHQGEDDSNGACAPFYEQNLITMVSEFRSRIIEDMRGSDARGPSANIPFVLGTMSKGVDDRGDFSNFSQAKSVVDSVHRNIAGLIPFSEVVLNDDLVPANGFPCGGGSCIHFGAAALREMGVRNYQAIVRAAGN